MKDLISRSGPMGREWGIVRTLNAKTWHLCGLPKAAGSARATSDSALGTSKDTETETQ